MRVRDSVSRVEVSCGRKGVFGGMEGLDGCEESTWGPGLGTVGRAE